MTLTPIFKSKTARTLWFLCVAAAVVAADQLAKNAVIAHLEPRVTYETPLGSLLRLTLVYNDSAAFSMGFGLTWIFTAISSVAAMVLVWYGLRVRTVGWSVLAGLALGGVTGNLIDRLFRAPGFGHGLVVDFIAIPFNFPIFNISDSAICITAALVVIQVARGKKLGG